MQPDPEPAAQPEPPLPAAQPVDGADGVPPEAPQARPLAPAVPAEPARPAVRIADADRERAAALLERATGEGRLTLEEFSVRVGAVWAARDSAELDRVMQDLPAAPPPVVGIQQAEDIVNVFSSTQRHGRWRLPRRMRLSNVFGETKLDLRDAEVGGEALVDEAVDITGRNVFGSVEIIVPEGVEVELGGKVVFGERGMRLAPVQRLAGTPVVRVSITTVFGETKVVSRGPNSGSPLARWVRGLLEQ